MNENLIFLASYPKSGNTWLRLFLANWMHDRDISMNDLGTIGFGAGDTRPDLYMHIADKPVEEIDGHEVAWLRPSVHQYISDTAGDSRVFVKTHNAVGLHDDYETVNSAVTDSAIYVVRDPRDVACSFAHHNGKLIDETIELMGREDALQGHGGTEIGQFLSTWSNHVLSWAHFEKPVHVIRYEDMKTKAFKTFMGVLRFLEGEEPDKARVQRAIKRVSFSKLQRQEKAEGFREQSDKNSQFFRKGQAGSWKKTLTQEQVNAIQSKHHRVMRLCGYLN